MVFDKPYQILKMGLDHFSARLFTIYNYACELSLALFLGPPCGNALKKQPQAELDQTFEHGPNILFNVAPVGCEF